MHCQNKPKPARPNAFSARLKNLPKIPKNRPSAFSAGIRKLTVVEQRQLEKVAKWYPLVPASQISIAINQKTAKGLFVLVGHNGYSKGNDHYMIFDVAHAKTTNPRALISFFQAALRKTDFSPYLKDAKVFFGEKDTTVKQLVCTGVEPEWHWVIDEKGKKHAVESKAILFRQEKLSLPDEIVSDTVVFFWKDAVHKFKDYFGGFQNRKEPLQDRKKTRFQKAAEY
jgi:hypothetical protein